MKKVLLLLGAVIISFSTIQTVNAETLKNPAYKVAVVDVTRVVAKSAQVQALKDEQAQKLKELQKWLTTVKTNVEKQKTQEEKDKLIKKYDVEFAKKQDAIKENYQTKLQAIDKSISATIEQQAKAYNYDIVLAKGTVLYGGDDITEKIIKVVK